MNEEEAFKRRKAFIETVTFFDIFDFALTREELCDYMLYKKWSLQELREFSNHEEFIIETHSHIYCRGRSHTVGVRKEKETRARKLIKKAKKYVKYMQMLPFVRMVGLCNSLAFYDAEKDSDIDLFIITEKKRLFTARLFSLLFTQLLALRRHGKKIKGRFCLSFYISKDNLDIGHIKRDEEDIYFIFWLRLMRPLIDQETYREFINTNKWIKKYFTYEIDQKIHLLPVSKPLSTIRKILEFPLKGKIGDLFEFIFKKIQVRRAENKAKKLSNREGIVISDNMLKFHDHDMRNKYTTIWKKRYSQFYNYLTPSQHGFEKPVLERSHQSRKLSESRFQDIFDMKNEEHERR